MVHGLLLVAGRRSGSWCPSRALAHPATLLGAGVFWLWFVGFAAATTVLVGRDRHAAGCPLVHGGLLTLLALVPRVFPLSLLRAGLDVLGRA